eukprot:364192-Chlamydomonas_euryale.AAC.4
MHRARIVASPCRRPGRSVERASTVARAEDDAMPPSQLADALGAAMQRLAAPAAFHTACRTRCFSTSTGTSTSSSSSRCSSSSTTTTTSSSSRDHTSSAPMDAAAAAAAGDAIGGTLRATSRASAAPNGGDSACLSCTHGGPRPCNHVAADPLPPASAPLASHASWPWAAEGSWPGVRAGAVWQGAWAAAAPHATWGLLAGKLTCALTGDSRRHGPATSAAPAAAPLSHVRGHADVAYDDEGQASNVRPQPPAVHAFVHVPVCVLPPDPSIFFTPCRPRARNAYT